MFGTILISVVTLTQLYVLCRVWSVPAVRRYLSGRSYIGLALLLWVTFLIGRMYGHDGHGQLTMLGEFLAMTWLGTLLLMMFSLLVVDAITLFGLLLRRHVSMLRGLALLTGTILTTAALVQGIRPPVIQDYELQIDELPIGGFGPNRQFSVLGAEAVHADSESPENQILARQLQESVASDGSVRRPIFSIFPRFAYKLRRGLCGQFAGPGRRKSTETQRNLSKIASGSRPRESSPTAYF